MDWFTQIMLYSHWSTQTECSTHSCSKQPLMKLCVAHCTHVPLVFHVVQTVVGNQLNTHVYLFSNISDESILVSCGKFCMS